MKTIQLLLAAIFLCAASNAASAQERAGSAPLGLGLGAEAMLLGGPAGPAIVYDMGHMHIDGILALASSDGGTQFGLGGRALWVLHSAGSADFSLGGGLGINHFSPDNDDSGTNVHLEGLAQIRAFIVQNVALSTTFGFGAALRDNDGPGGGDDQFAFTAQFISNAGLVYFFQ